MLVYWLDIVGTAVFAISGVLLAGKLRMDPFGVLVLGVVTAVGGGTIRDMALDNGPVFWVKDPTDLVVAMITSMLTILLVRQPRRLPKWILPVLDAVGLAVFVGIGVNKAFLAGTGPLVAICMGVITGVGGGIIRDVLAREVPMILRTEIYATACIVGGIFESVLGAFLKPLRKFFPPIVTGSVVIAIGLSLLGVGINYFCGGSGKADYGSLPNLFLGFVVLVVPASCAPCPERGTRPMLEVSHISKTFNAGTVNEKRALSDLSLRLADGEFATIVGSNGAGKSTLFNAIAGVFYVDAGTITLDGRDITFLPSHKRSRRIGHLFQDPLKGTAPHMTIEENLAVAYLRSPEKHKSFRRVTRRDRDFFRDALAQLDMGLEDRMNTPVGLLSGGQRQALTLLMATMVTPELLLLDEHTAALDPVTADKVLALTRSVVSERSISCLMITHNMHQALELGTRTLMMDAGRIVLDVSGPERADMTVQGLLDAFAAKAGEAFDNDRVLLSTAEDKAN